ncbi:C4-dicarboxylate ABC transporter [Parazoarcus communis]|uniref:C4-dicarboxylate ABC transporter n=1 Tax=Parazoarcus communis TaxID=41977 RepID=A0A2U8H534_9RHOO|nr:TRAP transporter substrate-binding protein [Parazoarcus communis]AWI81097.1 C4-dicarboxylate ABC transporter [Parazoarcus communis]
MTGKMVSALFASAMLATPLAQAAEVVLKVAHFWPTAAISQRKVLEPWCEKIKAASSGRMECQIYPSMQLGGTPPQLYQQAADGVADIVWTVPGYTAGRFPSVEVFELPFMARDAESTSRALWAYYEKYGRKDFAAVHPLALHVQDPGYIHTNKRQITKVDDLSGLKIRTPTRVTTKMFTALGATPVAMPMPSLPEALSKGVIDGYILTWESVPSVKLHELTRYHTETDASQPALYTAVFAMVMNKKRYESLPSDLKKVIDDNSGVEFSAAIGRAWDEAGPPARQMAVDRGNVLNMLAGSELDAFKKIGEQVSREWIEEMTAKGLPAQEMYDSARALLQENRR